MLGPRPSESSGFFASCTYKESNKRAKSDGVFGINQEDNEKACKWKYLFFSWREGRR
jgi:hypothetical protein